MSQLKSRKRQDYPYFLSYRTRWSDNDQYSHVNNSAYNLWFDSIINTYFIEHCAMDPATTKRMGLVISSTCDFFAPLSFPQIVDLGLRVNKLGNSSMVYETAVFAEGSDVPAAVGTYTLVFVDRATSRSAPMEPQMRQALGRLVLGPESVPAKL
ncbi:Thioesterase/thiol ester dehydrase-isomerase [Favolaschia claudopus]|uniref:Thioesterase/thiol ester dehydrase-isomerase n=1 Tax=Favolaschia claudopus TaxID=2862362 RepID=A0AAW0C5F4_9AGAR